jgi:hypothetical protein
LGPDFGHFATAPRTAMVVSGLRFHAHASNAAQQSFRGE